jgi:ArsR family transcriptional regulator, arsenate/arsenite/antimonite-responsive transcriptional repressor
VNVLITITKALADENRVRTLGALQHQSLCVCQIVELLELAPSTVSKHLAILRQAGLVTSQKKGRWIYFALPETHNEPLIAETLNWLFRSLEASEQYVADKKRLKQILNQDPVALCQRQNKPQT